MASSRSVYVSFTPSVYRHGKSQVLTCQAALLRSLRTLHNLRVLSRRRKDLRNHIIKLLDQVVREVNKIENKFPSAALPSKYKKKKKKVSTHKKSSSDSSDSSDNKVVETKRDYSKKQSIDEELFEIQRKLNMLR